MVLKYVFEAENPFLIILMALVLSCLGSYEAVFNKSKKRFIFMFPSVLMSMTTSCMTIGLLGTWLAMGVNPFHSPKEYIPTMGMLLGNCMTAITLGLDHCLSNISDNKEKIEQYLAMGATRWEAFQPIAREALRKAMLPTINQMSIIGLISIPGMMTGQLIAGASVLNAAKSQMIIMYLISSASAFGTFGAILLCFRICFDNSHRLRPERVIRNESFLPKSIREFPKKAWVSVSHYLCCCFVTDASSPEEGRQERQAPSRSSTPSQQQQGQQPHGSYQHEGRASTVWSGTVAVARHTLPGGKTSESVIDGPGGGAVTAAPNRHQLHRRSSHNGSFSRSHGQGTNPLTPPQSPNHHSSGGMPPSGYAGSSTRKHHSRRRNASFSAAPRTPPSSPQMGNAEASYAGFGFANSDQSSASFNHASHNRKRNFPDSGSPNSSTSHSYSSSSGNSSSSSSNSNPNSKPKGFPNAYYHHRHSYQQGHYPNPPNINTGSSSGGPPSGYGSHGRASARRSFSGASSSGYYRSSPTSRTASPTATSGNSWFGYGSSGNTNPNTTRHSKQPSSSMPAQSKQQPDKQKQQRPKLPTTPEERYKIVDNILETENLYKVLAVSRNATTEEIRRAYIAKSRVCHPDKFPEYPRATEAFQTYETLSKPNSRFVYDSTGGASGKSMLGGDETLQSVLSQVFFEFMDGDFEVIRNMINSMNNTAGGVKLGDDVIGIIEEMFLRLRFVLLGCKKYMTLIHDQVEQISEINHRMRSLAYLDVLGRFRLTLKLSKVMLTIPMIIQEEMRREQAVRATLESGMSEEEKEQHAKKNAGLVETVFLNDRVETVLKKVVSAIETGEKWV
ncbi:hypothetical protein BGW42_006562 [Actinomortierella wolfii]|nr:hypothetical protein BGW42_006562 [Actinomortierella wolfii]